jgi:hypothetical protein
MDKPFIITFNFPLEDSDRKIPVRAIAKLHHSEPYYKVHSFHVLTGKPTVDGAAAYSFLPDQEIKEIEEDGHVLWVHKESERPTLLSFAIGKAIEDSRPPGTGS